MVALINDKQVSSEFKITEENLDPRYELFSNFWIDLDYVLTQISKNVVYESVIQMYNKTKLLLK